MGGVVVAALAAAVNVSQAATSAAYNHWLHVSVEPNNPNVFRIDPRIVAAHVNH